MINRIYNCENKMLSAKETDGSELSVFVSTLVFGVFHIHMGFSFMIFAMIFLGGFGLIYIKQRTIWGLCVIRYVLGITATMLGWIG